MKTKVALLTIPLLIFGIAFSAAAEKTGERMVRLPKPGPVQVKAPDSMSKHCAECKPTQKTHRDNTGRGVVKEAKVISHDLCPSCERKRVVVGVGKQAKTEVRIVCQKKCCDLTKTN